MAFVVRDPDKQPSIASVEDTAENECLVARGGELPQGSANHLFFLGFHSNISRFLAVGDGQSPGSARLWIGVSQLPERAGQVVNAAGDIALFLSRDDIPVEVPLDVSRFAPLLIEVGPDITIPAPFAQLNSVQSIAKMSSEKCNQADMTAYLP